MHFLRRDSDEYTECVELFKTTQFCWSDIEWVYGVLGNVCDVKECLRHAIVMALPLRDVTFALRDHRDHLSHC